MEHRTNLLLTMGRPQLTPHFSKSELDYFYDQHIIHGKDIETIWHEYCLKSGKRFSIDVIYHALNKFITIRGTEVYKEQNKYPVRVKKELIFSKFSKEFQDLTVGEAQVVNSCEMFHRKTGLPIVNTEKGYIIAHRPKVI